MVEIAWNIVSACNISPFYAIKGKGKAILVTGSGSP
jgi:hypothetical protein